MKVLVDTCVWSAALRRKNSNTPLSEDSLSLQRLIRQHRAVMINSILQEVLTGIRDKKQFETLKNRLDAFELLPTLKAEHIYAAELSNTCRSNGIQGSHTDFLIAAASLKHAVPILTTDKDFIHYSKHIPIQLFTDPRDL
jgi:predicted nucleic acid-binding protein